MATSQRYVQGHLFGERPASLGVHGTFFPNYRTAVHRWYPYIEGFSSEFVQGLIDELAHPSCRIYDPFAGAGTTVTVAAANQMLPFFSEINPFMRLVIECKTNALRHIARRKSEFAAYIDQIQERASSLPSDAEASHELTSAFGDRPYFRGRRLVEIVALKRAILDSAAPTNSFLDLAKLAIASIAVGCSEMKRAADLRYRTEGERLSDDISPVEQFVKKARQILTDIEPHLIELPAATCLSESALAEPTIEKYVDLVITSPPYLNGTNYFRNTKIELWLTGLMNREEELAAFRDVAMAAGINDISSRGRAPTKLPMVEAVASQLDKVAYDRRIPELVRRYFSDSLLWIGNVSKLLCDGGVAVIDIGDSRFAGVHVPTDVILADIAQIHGLRLAEVRHVRMRKSKDGEPLRQVLLILQKAEGQRISCKPKIERVPQRDEFRDAAVNFGRDLQHIQVPYSSRNWGHKLHSLCSYQGKLKPAIAHFLVKQFSSPGDRVFDPLSGSGTVPAEAFLQGREPVGNDLQELGFILTKAKVESGAVEAVLEVQDDLLKHVDQWKEDMRPDAYSDFGLNGRIPDYFHPETYREVLAARRYIAQNECDSWSRAIVYSALLHILHGNRPYALSRRSHPVTPFKPTGPRDYRALRPRLRAKVARALADRLPENTINGKVTLGSFENVKLSECANVVITSPPFAASTRFFSTNWMRLWMTGWEPNDFESRRVLFLEHQQARTMDVYATFFTCAATWLRPGGRLIMHAGRTARTNMGQELERRASSDFELVYSFDEDVVGREKFGVRDQGATTSHQYLFFRRR